MVPEDWRLVKLAEVAEYRRGSFPQPYGLDEWYDDNNGTPFVQVYDVDTNFKLKPTTKRKISELAKAQSVFVPQGSLVLTIQGSIGRIAITQYDAYVDRTLLIFTGYRKPVNIYFFAHVVYLLFEIEKLKAPGGTIKTITKQALSSFKLALPPPRATAKNRRHTQHLGRGYREARATHQSQRKTQACPYAAAFDG